MNNIRSPSAIPLAAKKLCGLVTLALLSVVLAVQCYAMEDDADTDKESLDTQVTDFRTFVEIPDKQRKILQEDMLDHLAVLNEINRSLAENKLNNAADVAESGMGRSLLSKYQNEGMRPGRYMPKEMREIGWELHAAATQFAKVARQGNLQEALHAYHRITSACVACHYSFRTR
jgi:hypothetical protein